MMRSDTKRWAFSDLLRHVKSAPGWRDAVSSFFKRFPRFFKTIAFKVLALYTVAFSILATVFILYVGFSSGQIVRGGMMQLIEDEVELLVEEFERGGIRDMVEAVDRRSFRPNASLYLITDPAGRPLAGNISSVPPGVLKQPGMFNIQYARFEEGGEGATNHQALARVFVLPGGIRAIVGRDVSEREQFRTVIFQALRTSVVVLILIAVLSAFLLGRRFTRHLSEVSETSREIMEGNLSGRIPLSGSGDEFDQLSANLNQMLDRIEQLLKGIKQVSDNVAHDLKTPLTRMKSRIEQALRDPSDAEELKAVLESTLTECDDLIHIFNALLSIARAEAGEGQSFAPFDGVEMVSGLVELYEPEAEERGVELTSDLPEGLEIVGDRQLIAQALTNLLDNALKYGIPHMAGVNDVHGSENDPDAGPDASHTDRLGNTARSKIALSMKQEGEAILISVTDCGPGIPDADHARVKERFVRLDESRTEPGSGLGLSLVNAVATRHGGAVHLENVNPGLRVTLSLPNLSANKNKKLD